MTKCNCKSHIPWMSAVNSIIHFVILFNSVCNYLLIFIRKSAFVPDQGRFIRNCHYDKPAPENTAIHIFVLFHSRLYCNETSAQPFNITRSVRSFWRSTSATLWSAPIATLTTHISETRQPPNGLLAYKAGYILAQFFTKGLSRGYISVCTL